MRFWVLYVGLLGVLIAARAEADNRFTVGMEGLHDKYEEPSLDVDVSTYYTSVMAGYEHTKNGFFSAIDGRYSWGEEDYKSGSGTLKGEPSFETEFRLRSGLDVQMWHGRLMPYIGVGWRYYFDQGKGLRTNLGAYAYDRHISQFYIPLGGTYRFTSGNWTFSPTAEFDILAYGTVNTHLQAISHLLPPGEEAPDVSNRQRFGGGVGLRAEFMVGQQYQHYGWEAGPFVRYWDISDSNCVTTANYACLMEPHNTRLQAGAALRVNF